MPRVLSQRTLDLLDDMPPYLRDDPMTQAVVSAYSNEFQRIEDTARAILAALFPSQADDVTVLNGAYTVPLLSMLETLLGLPVKPSGVSIADRRAKVQAHVQKRNSGAASDWVAILSQALGTNSWSHQEGPGVYQVTILVPYAAGSYTAAQVETLARQITPAHLVISVGYSQGFLVGISLIGIEPL